MMTSSTTFRVSDTKPERHHYLSNPHRVCHDWQLRCLPHFERNHCTELLQTSNFPSDSSFSGNGFVLTVIECYNNHHNLIIRPDDIWAAIMTQFTFYFNKHEEEFRGKFVDFEGQGKKMLCLEGPLRTAAYDLLVRLEIDKILIDPEVRRWILPNFSTTTYYDIITLGVLCMASMKKYSDFKFSLFCGIPNVTLEGTLEDWKNIHGRLEKLKDYKLQKWYDMLEPILAQFVASKEGNVDLDFWQKICHHELQGSGSSYVCGWITTFCVFDKEGNWQGTSFYQGRVKWLKLDFNDIPTGIVEVDVKVKEDDETEHKAVMFAGHMAAEIKEDGYTVQPTLGWAIALKPDGDDEIGGDDKKESDEEEEEEEEEQDDDDDESEDDEDEEEEEEDEED